MKLLKKRKKFVGCECFVIFSEFQIKRCLHARIVLVKMY